MTIETDATEPGLRERKRRATRRAIQLAVLTLVAERGLENVTIDEVSRVADVSPRTFFNYFSSKEEALLGDAPQLPDGEALDRFTSGLSGESLLDGLEQVLIEASERSMDDAEMVQLRMNLVKGYPQLFALRMATLRTFEDQVAALVAQRIRHDEQNNPADIDSRARLVTLVAFGVMRHAWAAWATSGGAMSLAEQLAHSFDQFRSLVGTAIRV